jgi:type VI protein secretion system component VasK
MVLLAAVGMLVLGETLLAGRLPPWGFLLYWLVCIALTALAMAIALVDVWVLRARARREQRALFENALREVAEKAEKRAGSREKAEKKG